MKKLSWIDSGMPNIKCSWTNWNLNTQILWVRGCHFIVCAYLSKSDLKSRFWVINAFRKFGMYTIIVKRETLFYACTSYMDDLPTTSIISDGSQFIIFLNTLFLSFITQQNKKWTRLLSLLLMKIKNNKSEYCKIYNHFKISPKKFWDLWFIFFYCSQSVEKSGSEKLSTRSIENEDSHFKDAR